MKFNIEVDHIEAGDVIEQSECESVIGIKRDADQYQFQFALMQLGEFISSSLWKIGKQFTVKTENGSVVVLTHEQASKYNASRFQNAIGKMRRCHRKNAAVNLGEIPEESRQDHVNILAKQGAILTGIRSSKAVLDVKPTPAAMRPVRLARTKTEQTQ